MGLNKKNQWTIDLTKNQENILKKGGTEPPGSSALNDEKRNGYYLWGKN